MKKCTLISWGDKMKEELLQKMRERVADEIGDIKTYEDLARKAREMGEDFAAFILQKISHEEETHADMIREIVGDMEEKAEHHIHSWK